jgi:hypothetical protein
MLLAASVWLGSAPVEAQSTDKAATAESLFQEGKSLMAARNFVAACPKLAESQRLDPSTGTLTALALCHEGEGKSASAWAEFMEVVVLARKDGRVDREKLARTHAAALEKTLSRLSIVVPPAIGALDGFTVRRDGEEVGQASWGSPLPVDPGVHAIEATARGKLLWKTTITVGPMGAKESVTVASLEDAPPPPAAVLSTPALPVPVAADAGRGGGTRVVAFVLGGVGVAALGVGSYFGVEAITKSQDAKKVCTPQVCTSQSAVAENNTAKTYALVSDFTIGAGIAALGVGAVLFLTSRGSSPGAPSVGGARLVPMVGRDGGGIALRGAF